MFYERFEMGRDHQIIWRVYCVKSGVVSYKLHANTNIISKLFSLQDATQTYGGIRNR